MSKKSSSEVFRALINKFTYKGKSRAPVCNFTFFLGAGFSKSWDERFPTGNELFHLPHEFWEKSSRYVVEFLDSLNYKSTDDLDPRRFKDLVYSLGMFRKYPEIRPRYVDDGNIEIVERELRGLTALKFHHHVNAYHFSETDQKILFTNAPNENQRKILELFQNLLRESDGSQGVSEGIRCNFVSTNYDCLT